MLRTLIIWMSIVNMEFPTCHADRFYCMGTGTIRIQLDYELRSEHNIIPEFDFIELKSRDTSNGDQCTWQFFHHSTTAVNVILQGIDRKLLRDVRLHKRSIQSSESEHASIPYGIRYPKDASCDSKTEINYAGNLTLETFQVITLLPRDMLTLSIQSQQSHKSPFGLKLTAIDVGYCTRLTARHNSNCYHINRAKLTLNETLATMRQSSMELAHFESLMDVKNFIQASKFIRLQKSYQLLFGIRDALFNCTKLNILDIVQEDVFPTKQPLDLTNPVRIGLFHVKGGQLKRSAKMNGTCKIENYENSSTFLRDSQTQCVSLKVNSSGSPAIELVDCNQPMPALISFPETPLTNSCVDCSREIEKLLMDSQKKGIVTASVKFPKIFIIFSGIVPILLTLVFVRVKMQRFFSNRSQMQREESNSLVKSTENQIKNDDIDLKQTKTQEQHLLANKAKSSYRNIYFIGYPMGRFSPYFNSKDQA